MSEASWPEFIATACQDTWIDESPTLLGEDFKKRWGGFTYEVLRRVLFERTREERVFDERVFALFLVAYVAPERAKDLLQQFAHVDNIKERWAATMSLGRLHAPQAFPLLQDILLAWLLDFQRYQTSLLEDVDATWLSEMGSIMDWCGDRCHMVILLLGTRENPQTIQTLDQALQICWTNIQRSVQLKDDFYQRNALSVWYRLEDYLVYATGMLGAWEALRHLGLSDVHFRVAVIYQALGALHIPPPYIFGERGWPYFLDFGTPVSSQRAFGLAPVSLRPEPVAHILQEYLGFSPEESREYIVRFRQALDERTREGYVRKEENEDSLFGLSEPF